MKQAQVQNGHGRTGYEWPGEDGLRARSGPHSGAVHSAGIGFVCCALCCYDLWWRAVRAQRSTSGDGQRPAPSCSANVRDESRAARYITQAC